MGMGNYSHGFREGIMIRGAGMFDAGYGRVWYVDAKTGADGNSGRRRDRPYQTMSKAFANIDSGDTILFRGKVREELSTPAGVFDVTIIGAANRPRHADDHSEDTTPGRGSSSATWTTPASPTAATPLLIVRQQGWRLQNFLLDGPSDAAALRLFRDAGAGDAEDDASHAHIIGCKFVAGQDHIEFHGGLSQVMIEESNFFGATTTSLKNTTGAGVGTNNHYIIRNNTFHDNVNHLVMPTNYATIVGNAFGKKTTTGISLSGGSENLVYNNYLYGTYSNAGGYTAGTNDEWAGNWNVLSGGVTAADPA